MSVLTKQTIMSDTFIVVLQSKNFGYIIESNTVKVQNNIFDIYDMLLSEVEYIKRNVLKGKDAFSALTSSGDVLVFSRMKRSAYIMGVVRISIECMKYIAAVFPFITTSPTLTRKLRRCQQDGEFQSVCRILSLFYGIDICEDRLGEFIYMYAREYSEAYDCDVNIQSIKACGINPIGAVMCEEMLHIYLHCLFIIARKSDAEKIDIKIDEISDRAIIHSQICIRDNENDLSRRLDCLLQIAEAYSVSLKYKLDGDSIQISLCPYFIDDSQQGLKSKILFEF